MKNWFKTMTDLQAENSTLSERNIELEDEVRKLRDRISDLETEVDENNQQKNKKYEEVSECSFMVNFNSLPADRIQVVSVERVLDSSKKKPYNEHTIVGIYFPNAKDLYSWHLYCSREQHELLTQEFTKVCNYGE